MTFGSTSTRPTLWTRWPVTDRADVGAARRYAIDRLGAWRAESAAAALIVTELGTNLVKHAGGGTLCMGPSFTGSGWEVLALDGGPGMTDVERCLTDRFSTAQTSGTGLGAIARHSEDFAITSGPRGTLAYARVGGVTSELPVALQLPHPRQAVSGDAWRIVPSPTKVRLLMIDALGHGPQARLAAEAAAHAATDASPYRPSADVLADIHRLCLNEGLRGAVAAVVDITADAVDFAAVGTVTAFLEDSRGVRRLLPSLPGTLGNTAPRLVGGHLALHADDRVVLHTDGFAPDRSGLAAEHAGLIAARLCRDGWRSNDDASALVVPVRWAVEQLQAG